MPDKASKIEQIIMALEQRGQFDKHIFPINFEETKPVDEDFPYIPKGWLKLKYSLINLFIVRPFRWYKTKIVYKTKIKGKKNLKGVKSAIVTSNHIAIYDCMANSYALKEHKLKIVAAEFNNKTGCFGGFMRAHGILPLSSKFKVLRKFNNAVEHHLLHDSYVLIYPEESMWPMYEKPRPYKNGAFHYAAKFQVPVVPIFITLRDSGKKNKDGEIKKYFTVNISPPIYPKTELNLLQNTKYLKDAAYSACTAVYEKAYGKKLSFSNEGKNE